MNNRMSSSKLKTIPKSYVGDSIYIEDKGHAIVLTTDNGEGASNTIIIEPEQWFVLIKHMERIQNHRESLANFTLTPGGM